MVRAAGGDVDARAALVTRHGPLVWSLCRRLCPEPEDAYQEVWARVFAGLPRFDPDGAASLRTWIATITHRHLVDRHRRRAVRGEVVELGDLPAPATDEPIDAARRLERLEQALTRLPDGHRRVVVMHHLHELPLESIAATEGVALGTVKSRLHRARARLLELLGGP
ncbi:MAG: sigma-70 family RNA polymerase sigma factor [Myxococcota bacterium]